MTVSDVLDAPCEYDHALEVRSIGPAVVLVLERDAPMRLEVIASTEAERDALHEWIARSCRAAALLDLYFTGKAEEEGIGHTDLWEREDAYAARLAAGHRLADWRATDRAA